VVVVVVVVIVVVAVVVISAAVPTAVVTEVYKIKKSNLKVLILLQGERICSRQPVKPALQPVVGMPDSLTLEASTYDWALRLPYEILKPKITPQLVNFEFYLNLVKVLMNIIVTDLSSGMKVYSKNRSLHYSYIQMNRLFERAPCTCTCNLYMPQLWPFRNEQEGHNSFFT